MDPLGTLIVSLGTLIVLDFDDTEDPVHGEQEQARYDGYDGGD